MTAAPLERTSTVDALVAALRTRILDAELQGGERPGVVAVCGAVLVLAGLVALALPGRRPAVPRAAEARA